MITLTLVCFGLWFGVVRFMVSYNQGNMIMLIKVKTLVRAGIMLSVLGTMLVVQTESIEFGYFMIGFTFVVVVGLIMAIKKGYDIQCRMLQPLTAKCKLLAVNGLKWLLFIKKSV